MELKRRSPASFNDFIPDYKSTKAALDELEKRQERIIKLVSDKEYDFGQHIIKIWDRLTALEEQPSAEYFEKLFRDLAHKITALESHREIHFEWLENHGERIEALEAKVAPEPQTKITVGRKVWIFDGVGWHEKLEAEVDAPMHCEPITCANYDEIKQPPLTCGNCKKAWQAVENPEDKVLVCDKRPHGSFTVQYHDLMPCPHHERREA